MLWLYIDIDTNLKVPAVGGGSEFSTVGRFSYWSPCGILSSARAVNGKPQACGINHRNIQIYQEV
jgi:hypothetical protein